MDDAPSASPSPYLDTRLYVTVRPASEYKIPNASMAIVAALLGDLPTADALNALDECEIVQGAGPPEEERARALPEAVEETLRDVWQGMTETLGHMHDHLEALRDAWEAHVIAVHADVVRTVAAMQRHAARATPHETASLRQDLEAALSRIRERPAPTIVRPEALTCACDRLRRLFAERYGTVPTRHLLAARAVLEGQLIDMERTVADKYLRTVARLLRK